MEKRRDDRDARKSDDLATDNPIDANKTVESQQAAELQIGHEDEREDLSRFEPDQKSDMKDTSVKQSSSAEKDTDSEP
ncbi:MAG TPA: hypothetical protein VNN73_03245 [Blastocatellia bacterium]|nr:hypothetical protein [Blastocatellia bacterium]